MKNIIKYTGILAISALMGMMFTSCSEKLPKNEVQPYGTELTGIKIVNAGPNQDKVVEGTVDPATMTITFPRISAKSNFGELKFEITASEGATLELETYDFSMDEEETDKGIKIPTERVRKFFPKNYTAAQMEEEIIKMCESRYRKRQRNRDER